MTSKERRIKGEKNNQNGRIKLYRAPFAGVRKKTPREGMRKKPKIKEKGSRAGRCLR